jgi:fucose permease
MSFGLGAFAGPLAAAAVLTAFDVYWPIFVGIAAVLVPPLVILSLLPLPGPRHHHEAVLRLPRAARPAVLLLATVTFLYLGAEVGFGGWIFTYVRQTTTATMATASWATAAYWLALSISSLGAAVRPRRLRAEGLVFACALGAATAALCALAARGHVTLELAAAAALGLCLGPIYPLSLASAAGLVPAAAGRVAALVIASSQIGATLLPWVQGLLLALGPGWAVALTATLCSAMAALQLAFTRAWRPIPVASD